MAAQADIDAQIDALRAKAASAIKNQQLLESANEELKQALELKIASLGQGSDTHMAQAEQAAAVQSVEQAIGEQLTPQWKEMNGLASVPNEGIHAIILLSLRLAGAHSAALSKAVPSAMESLTKKQKIGGGGSEFPGYWTETDI